MIARILPRWMRKTPQIPPYSVDGDYVMRLGLAPSVVQPASNYWDLGGGNTRTPNGSQDFMWSGVSHDLIYSRDSTDSTATAGGALFQCLQQFSIKHY